jgi:DNA-binding response OmpR family regulator
VTALAVEPMNRATTGLGVLIVECEEPFADAVTALMRRRGWRPFRVDGEGFPAGLSRSMLARVRPDVVLVEPAAVPVSPEQWVANVSALLPGLPIVVCAWESTLERRISGLRAGVDHWIPKPVASEELLATLEAAARHRRVVPTEPAVEVIEVGELRIDVAARMCTIEGRILGLTVKEFGVLTQLALRRGRIVNRAEVFSRVWGWTMLERDRTIDVYVRRLRAKLEEASPGWVYIHTHKGRGYRFEASRIVAADTREHDGTGA